MKIQNGDRVRFKDVGNVKHGSPEIIESVGTVNGEPIMASGPDWQYAQYWPVFTERDNGREATTVFIHEGNIIGKVQS